MTQVQELARFVERTSYEDLSQEAVRELKVRILDALGCAIGALEGQPVRRIREQIEEFGGNPLATLMGGGRTAPDRAALYNGALVRYLDYNDSYLAPGETCHPSDNLGAVLAAAEYAGGSGRDLLAALAVAYQVQCRLSEVAPVRHKGFDHTTQGAYAAAAGAAKVLGLDARKTMNAVAISGTANNALRVTRTGPLSHWKGLAYPNTGSAATHAAFLDELMEPRKKNPNYTFVGTMTGMEKSSREWHGETGYITKSMLLKYVGDLTLPIYYIDGPPAMVTAMRETLGEAGVDGDNIRTEEFSGYSEAEQEWDMNIKIKRVYEQPDKDDGRRILVDRIWPRGISKDKARLSDWRKDLAPSNELRKWFGHEPDRWEEFKERYRAELEEAGKMGDLRDIAERAGEENVTLLFGAKDTKHNNARALEAFVGEV